MLHINLKYISLPLIERDLKGKSIEFTIDSLMIMILNTDIVVIWAECLGFFRGDLRVKGPGQFALVEKMIIDDINLTYTF